VIAMTANVLPQQVRDFMAAGMNGHLGKPFTRNQLIDKVNLFLSPSRARAGDMATPSASRAAAFDSKALDEMTSLLGAAAHRGMDGGVAQAARGHRIDRQ
jgi:CheY-like chemotaxis protein